MQDRGQQKSKTLLHEPIVSLTMAIANVVHFAGTFLNHASRCYLLHRLDVAGMFCIVFCW